jgi:aminoglycoside phosphotransferase (APT) family kinase protein
MPPEPSIDVAALDAYLSRHIEGYRGPLSIEQFQGGQSNPTYRLTTPGGDYVLRRKPPGPLLPSAHAVDREFRVISALAATAVPVPKAYLYCADEGVVGTPFYVMEYLPGRIFYDPRLPGLAPGERGAIYDSMNAALAALHRVDPAAVGLADYGRPGNYFARQIARWSKQYRAVETRTIPAMDRLIDWLPAHVPPQGPSVEETAIVHGDFRLDNMIFHASSPRVLAIIDWELSTLGHPLADLSYNCLAWHFTPELFRGLAGCDLQALGIPGEADYVAAYRARVRRGAIEHWSFYLAYNIFRLAAILEGVWARSLAGNAVGDQARAMGPKVEPLAELAWQEARKHECA